MNIFQKLEKDNNVKYKVFGLTVLKVKMSQSTKKYYLFGSLPILEQVNRVTFTKAQYDEKKQYYDMYVAQIVNDIKNIPSSSKEVMEFKNKVELTDIEVLPSLLDPLGKVIKKDGKIYRGVYPQSVDHFKKLWQTGLLQGLAKHNLLVDIKFTNYYTEDFPLIVECQQVNIIPSTVWTFTQKKESALLTLLINKIANKFNYQLIDGHTSNVTFQNGKAIFFDLGSFIVYKKLTGFYNEILATQLRPLWPEQANYRCPNMFSLSLSP